MGYIMTALVLVAFIIFDAQANQTKSKLNRDSIVNEVIQKVGNLSINSIASAPLNKRKKMIEKIKDKLEKAASFLGPDSKKYIELIMQGIMVMSVDNKEKKYEKKKDLLRISESKLLEKDELRDNNYSVKNINETKEQLIKSIANKIEILTKESFKNAKTPGEKRLILEHVKKRAIGAVNKNHGSLRSGNKTQTYSDLISEGVELMMHKSLLNGTRRLDNDEFSVDVTNNDIDVTSTTFATPVKASGVCNCDCVIENVCLKIKAVNKLSCPYDESEIDLDKLCNGIVECPDKSDEKTCAKQAKESVQNVNQAINEIEKALPKNCFTKNGYALTDQKTTLLEILQYQVNFIDKYKEKETYTKLNASEAVNAHNVALLVSSIAYSLEGAFCASELRGINKDLLREATEFDVDEIITEAVWATKSCACSHGFCSYPNCKDACRRICWNKYTLSRWTCKAIDNGGSVSLDTICDGKIDCFDESDENGCATGQGIAKFEARDIFKNILKLLTTKTSSSEFAEVRNLLISLHSSVKNLEKLNLKPNDVDMTIYKNLRDECFSIITLIYEEILKKGSAHDEGVEVYKFLMSLNEKLVTALKRSITGNSRIVPADTCFCRNGHCAVVNCSRNCDRACTVQPILTRYTCGKSDEQYVPIKAVCDGKKNCPNGEDEINCNSEVCRYHHLMLLRHRLKDVGGKDLKGTATGEALTLWNTKVISTLKLAEQDKRPTRLILIGLINSLLRDLVMTYASLEEYRRKSIDNTQKEFANVAQLVIETIKSCGYYYFLLLCQTS